ncbi:long-chain-fatty-acid--CoA ligase [Rhodococcoides kroppenstedtii]|uniref:long-chain-fatty-acid--CoA ligase n=1 Tax=Rhodococcoides kroppenstedtii TaxID=293050 RepID=UPI00362FDCF9
MTQDNTVDTSSPYLGRPWLSRYTDGVPSELSCDFEDGLSMFRGAVHRAPDKTAVLYFDGSMTFAELDTASDGFAAALRERGISDGDRVALFLQNVPQYVISLLGIWKAGATAVAINPMSRERELTYQLTDSGATVLVCLESLYADVARAVVPTTAVSTVFTTSELEYQHRHDPRLFAASSRHRYEDTVDFVDAVTHHAGGDLPTHTPAPSDLAVLTYTSGTTGPPKGAMTSHSNVAFNSQVYRDWWAFDERDVVLAIAPLFHITGMIGHIGVAMTAHVPLVLGYRFDPGVVLDLIREHKPTFTVGAITVFTALLNHVGFDRGDFASFRLLCSGGAPISPASARNILQSTGLQVHNIYGLTETTSPTHSVPLGAETPVDPTSGALSVGVPVPNTLVRVVDEAGADVPVGEVGELVTRGPQVVRGYWNKPAESANAIRDGWFFSGDVGFMDAEGWFYIVDRKKDMINASGYKVWPREVEDVLAEHDAVLEAAVVGVPDEYRGETVKAFVSLKAGHTVSPEALIDFAKARMAAYKYPRAIDIVDHLPKTATGKILRRELRR